MSDLTERLREDGEELTDPINYQSGYWPIGARCLEAADKIEKLEEHNLELKTLVTKVNGVVREQKERIGLLELKNNRLSNISIIQEGASIRLVTADDDEA